MELGKNPSSKHQIQPEYGDEEANAGRDCRTRLGQTKFSGAKAYREISIFLVQLTTSRIGNLLKVVLSRVLLMAYSSILLEYVLDSTYS